MDKIPREVAGDNLADWVREAITQYWGKSDPTAVKGAISDLQERVASLERKLAGLGAIGWLMPKAITF